MTLTLKVKRLTETAKLPTYAHNGDACFDIYSDGIEEHNLRSDEYFEVHSTGLSFDFKNRITSYNVCYTKLLRVFEKI